jgi:hypothetical protein
MCVKGTRSVVCVCLVELMCVKGTRSVVCVCLVELMCVKGTRSVVRVFGRTDVCQGDEICCVCVWSN